MKQPEKLGDGEIVEIESREKMFKLVSYYKNPVVKPKDLGLTWYESGNLRTGAVFNPGATLFQDKIILTPRCHRDYKKGKYFDPDLKIERYCLENYISQVWPLFSEDGINFKRFQNVSIRGDGTEHKDFLYGVEDIRIIPYGKEFLLIGCGKVKPPFKGRNADRVCIYSTDDFVNIKYHGMISSFDSRNAIPFFLDEKVYILLRFHPNIHLAYLEGGIEQLFNPQKYLKLWEKIYNEREKNLLLEAGKYEHESEKIGPSTPLIKTDNGWLLIYHAVGRINRHICKEYQLEGEIERGYSICACLLDLSARKIISRTKLPVYIPSKPYELYGNDEYPVDVPAVVFPVGCIRYNDKVLIYCGAGDKYVTLLSFDIKKFLSYLVNAQEV